ncbi:hypothetical protein Cgig2_025032 [Carnegiea gigantea]|uniref:Uncharacterized protein n=1 Tax=Carnegiea gigantea TaxID=171969 RepID=A0A9Q1K036_9CARY|nr:hypothetical protein Cgig2_025032 [Carnegiea gigantea]
MDTSIVEGREDEIEECKVAKKSLDIEVNEGDEDRNPIFELRALCYNVMVILDVFYFGVTMQMIRKMNLLITASQMNMNTRAHCEKYFIERKKLIELDVRSIHCEENGQGKSLNSSKIKKLSMNDVASSTSTSQGAFPLMSFHPTYYFDPSNSSSVFIPMMISPASSIALPLNLFANHTYSELAGI